MRKSALIAFLALTACARKPMDYRRGDVVKVDFKDRAFYSNHCEDSGKVLGYIGSSRKYLVAVRCFRGSYISEDLIWVDSDRSLLGAF